MSTDELELQTKLAKALADADYWRLAYDKLLSHMEHNNQYIQHLGKQMNANELADELEAAYSDNDATDYMIKAATMLRQQQAKLEKSQALLREYTALNMRQQAEIEALKKEAALQRLSDFTQEAANEPVAWMEIEYGGFTEYKVWREPVSSKSIPLYTHPAKTLTNEEISDIRDKFFAPDGCNIYTFARALLKKASEI